MSKTIICLLITAIILINLFSCATKNTSDLPISVIVTNDSKSTSNEKIYIDDIIFFGESTTYHLKSRGVLSGGTETTQVWAPKSGTLMLEPTTSECRIIYPELKEEISLTDAIKQKKPRAMLLTFGLNGATNFIKRGESYFKFCYQKLLSAIKEASPDTKIIINSCFPIAKNMNMSSYTIDAKQLNSYINTLNQWACQLAKENGAIYTDSASVIKDENGFLAQNLQAEDGYHLNKDAYKLILNYLSEELQNKEN